MNTNQRTQELGVRSWKLKGGGARRDEQAFTLIELLVVIGIIGLLAALIVGSAGYAKTARTKALVRTELAAMETAINGYQKAKGFYPPDHAVNSVSVDSVQTPLFYELTGTQLDPKGNFLGMDQQTFTPGPGGTLNALFATSGILNCSNAETASKNFFGGGLKNSQHQLVAGAAPNQGVSYSVLGIGVDGPLQLNAAIAGQPINPWHYVSSNPTNNHDSYDLWMDVKYGGKNYRFSNWSVEPQPF